MNKKIVNAFNDIDDKYIESAHFRFSLSRLINWSNIGKLAIGCCCFVLAIFTYSTLFESKSSNASFDAVACEEEYDFAYATSNVENSYSKSEDSDEKLIVNASMEIETSKYEDTIQNIETILKEVGGYAQSISTNTSSNSNRYYEATLRIPSERYEQFIQSLKDSNSVSYYNESVEDITSTYTDLKARLSALKAQEEKVLEFYKEAENIEDLMSIESRLSDLRYEIESIESKIQNYDILTSYATLHINVQESIVHVNSQKFSDRLANSFVNGWSSFVEGVENIILFFTYHFVFVILIGIIAGIGYSAVRRKKR